jgi:hypothetical protein
MPAYIIPYDHDCAYWRIRFKVPEGYPYGKYKAPKGMAPRIYVPPQQSRESYRDAQVKWICEGEKKAVKLLRTFGVPTVGISGCWMWGHRVKGERTLLPELQDLIKSGDQVIYVADRDILDPKKLDIGKAAKALMHVIETSMNCEFKLLLPPEPHKGADDWLASMKRANTDDMDEVDIGAYAWFPLKALLATGITFKPDKDGNVLGYKQAIANNRNSELLAQLIYANNPGTITLDKYRGYLLRDRVVGPETIINEMTAGINDYFPEYKVVKDGIRHFMVRYCEDLGMGSCVKDYLESLTWDGTRRLEDWLPKAMELSKNMDESYAAQVGRTMVAAMYSRIMRPGEQQDFMFILVGDQGIGKSQFFRTLGDFPVHQGYHATAMNQLSSIDYTLGLALKESVVLDVDDLETMRRADQGELKSFISRTHDAWREIYTTRMIREPRGFILTGSTNNRDVLSDLTGNRRYLMLEVNDIRGIKGPSAWSPYLRDQLLAECHARWAELKDDWWNVGIEAINANNAMFIVDDAIVTGIKEMLENDKLLKVKSLSYVTPTALQRWIDDPRLSSTAIGMRLAKLVYAQHMPFKVLFKRQLMIGDGFFDDYPDDIARLFRPQNQVARLWAYPVKSE